MGRGSLSHNTQVQDFFQIKGQCLWDLTRILWKVKNRMDWNEMAQGKGQWAETGWDGTEQEILTGLSSLFFFF